MKRIFVSENYIVVDKDDGGASDLYSLTASFLTEHIDHFLLESDNKGGESIIIPYTESSSYFNEAGDTAFTETTLRTFFRANTQSA